MATSSTYSLRARYIFPIDRPPIRDGCITITAGQIVDVGDSPTSDCRDLGDVAILPGLINAHTHLEFSELAQPLGQSGMPFTDWIREVIRWRRATQPQGRAAERDQVILSGLEECTRSGTTTIGEIATPPWTGTELRYELMRGVSFLELLGLANERHDELLTMASEYIETSRRNALSPLSGLSPHASYTVSPQLVESVAALSATTHTPVAMHLAETREELELLRSGGGPFRELLDDLGAWQHDAIPQGSTPLDYLKLLARANRALIIHGNYLSQAEIEFAGSQHERMSVIYCPRTHAYFQHDRYPLREMLACHVNVAVGTDSRASNPDLNLLSELRFVAQQHQDVPPETILRLATINAAQALGLEQISGTLTPGKRADFVAVSVSTNLPADPHDLLFAERRDVKLVFREGQQYFPALAERQETPT